MKHIICVWLFLLCINLQAQTLHQKTWAFQAMGSAFTIAGVHADTVYLEECLLEAKAEIQRIERLISSWDENSQTSLVNQNAGIQPIKVDKELFQLIQRSLKISILTNGAFDISYASMVKVWTFDGSEQNEIDSTLIQKSVSKVNYKNIILDVSNTTIFLKEKGMRIGFGGIGKGYAADKVKIFLLGKGIQSGVVNAGGDLIAWGKPVNSVNWTAGIANPNERGRLLGTLNLDNNSIVTSGDYEKFVLIGGKRYAHIINPKTGFPTDGIKSVTVVCPIAEMGDALATSIFVMGVEKGLSLVNQLKGIECLIIDENNKVITSENLSFQKSN